MAVPGPLLAPSDHASRYLQKRVPCSSARNSPASNAREVACAELLALRSCLERSSLAVSGQSGSRICARRGTPHVSDVTAAITLTSHFARRDTSTDFGSAAEATAALAITTSATAAHMRRRRMTADGPQQRPTRLGSGCHTNACKSPALHRLPWVSPGRAGPVRHRATRCAVFCEADVCPCTACVPTARSEQLFSQVQRSQI